MVPSPCLSPIGAKLTPYYNSKSANGRMELVILSQPEEQHRARYLTEGSRGAIKDVTGMGHPVVKLNGYFSRQPIKLECYIGHDKHNGLPHLFYQASKISGKNSTQCTACKVEGTSVIVMNLLPDHGMQATIDCVGILKERNVDVEQKLLNLNHSNIGGGCAVVQDHGQTVLQNGNLVALNSRKRSVRCRLVFRVKIPETGEVLQTISTPIICTQPLGTPEICKKSLVKAPVLTNQLELFIIGKNFLKDSKIVFRNKKNDWIKVVEPDKEFLNSSHLICKVPDYDGPEMGSNIELIETELQVRSGGKFSEAHTFTYVNNTVRQQPPPPQPQPDNNNAGLLAQPTRHFIFDHHGQPQQPPPQQQQQQPPPPPPTLQSPPHPQPQQHPLQHILQQHPQPQYKLEPPQQQFEPQQQQHQQQQQQTMQEPIQLQIVLQQQQQQPPPQQHYQPEPQQAFEQQQHQQQQTMQEPIQLQIVLQQQQQQEQQIMSSIDFNDETTVIYADTLQSQPSCSFVCDPGDSMHSIHDTHGLHVSSSY